ncbi:hypothetical protein L3V79_05590 [Thiotrichales bacterium 19S9-12]|nr:hypothetical protein [Thiotrichales bacterium 19S9-11]MCF6811832.1 hypothetical protein [Thiotrichales bacterium 19S9-12]
MSQEHLINHKPTSLVTFESVICFILGVISLLICWNLPYISLIIAVAGIVSGALARFKIANDLIRISMVLCVISAALSIILVGVESYIVYKGY